MSKKGGKDGFGNAAAQFDRIARQNKTIIVDMSLSAQIARLEEYEKEEAAKAAKAKADRIAKSEEVRFSGAKDVKAAQEAQKFEE